MSSALLLAVVCLALGGVRAQEENPLSQAAMLLFRQRRNRLRMQLGFPPLPGMGGAEGGASAAGSEGEAPEVPEVDPAPDVRVDPGEGGENLLPSVDAGAEPSTSTSTSTTPAAPVITPTPAIDLTPPSPRDRFNQQLAEAEDRQQDRQQQLEELRQQRQQQIQEELEQAQQRQQQILEQQEQAQERRQQFLDEAEQRREERRMQAEQRLQASQGGPNAVSDQAASLPEAGVSPRQQAEDEQPVLSGRRGRLEARLAERQRQLEAARARLQEERRAAMQRFSARQQTIRQRFARPADQQTVERHADQRSGDEENQVDKTPAESARRNLVRRVEGLFARLEQPGLLRGRPLEEELRELLADLATLAQDLKVSDELKERLARLREDLRA